MRVRSLVKIIEGKDGGIHLTFSRPALSLPYAAKNKKHAIEVARKFCSDTIDREGRPWVSSWSGDGNTINCPEGFIKLPADIWCCKLSGEMCLLQSSIRLNDKPTFIQNCHASAQKKEAIFSTVQNGKYGGFHHVPGRKLCVACEEKGGKQTSFFYHYHWEFAELDYALGKSYEETLIILKELGLPSTYVMCPICASCCYEEAIKIQPSLEQQLKVLEFNIDFRKGNTN